MKKWIIYAICIILSLGGGACIGVLFSKEQRSIPQPQKVLGNYDGGKLYVVVETDKDIYEYNEYVHVTITLINHSKDSIEIFMPESVNGANQGISAIIENADNRLINVDTHIIDGMQEERTVLLEPGEKYIQSMRFSTNRFNNQHGELIYTENEPLGGIYKGIVTVSVIEKEGIVPFQVEFTVDIKEKE